VFANPASVVINGSVNLHIGMPTSSVYAATKAAMISLTKTLSGELISRGIRVNAVSAGPIMTPLHSGRSKEEQADKGYKVISVQNPTTSLEDDVAATKRAIDRADADVVLVGHSWGGSVITEAGADPRVKALVYIAAFAPDKGETPGSLGESVAPTILPGFIQNANGYLTLSREGVAKGFAGDLSPKEQDVVYAVQQPAFQKVFSDVGVNAAWKTKPSWYVVASEDNAINPELEKRMAKRANAKTTILKSSHVAMLSKPNEVLNVILDATKGVSK
jgi:pimeloyl-ACP methyl ester carboxylesterase